MHIKPTTRAINLEIFDLVVITNRQNHPEQYFLFQHQDLKAYLLQPYSSLAAHINNIHNLQELDDSLNNYQIKPDE